jgi:hypothetical protein
VEAKARYRAVENTTTMGCNAKEKKKCIEHLIIHQSPKQKKNPQELALLQSYLNINNCRLEILQPT